MKIKPLICYWRPKDIQPVLDGLKKCPCDQLFLNYMPYPDNYIESRKFFLEHKEYTHYVALPNDLVPTKEIYEKLVATLEKEDYPVLSGCCNVDMQKFKDFVNVCLTRPALSYSMRVYKWLTMSQRKQMIDRGFAISKFGFAGFPFMFIRRDIVEKIPFAQVPFETKDRPIWETEGGFGGDLAFCTSCDFHKIPVMVDLTCIMDHLRFYGEMLVGKKPPNIEFIKWNEQEKRHESKIEIQGLRQESP